MLKRIQDQALTSSTGERSGRAVVEPFDPVRIRVSPHSYFIALLLGSFFSAFLYYLEFDLIASVLFIFAWIAVPFLALTDQLVFDGRCLVRAGILPSVWSRFHGTRRRLKLTDIEQIETQAIRTIKRGGNLYYRYRTAVRGRGLTLVFASGGDEYRRMIGVLLPLVSENILDRCSLDLRDHLSDSKETLMKAEFEHIPSAGFLRAEFERKSTGTRSVANPTDEDRARADYLTMLGNELRINGYLLQGAEAFRRALVMDPQNSRILYGLGSCLLSIAGTERNVRLERRAFAALRLAQRDPLIDGETLARIGEAFFQSNELTLAERAFRRVQDDLGGGFRAALGLAEIALRESKLAYVIHHFSTANRVSETPALRRWTRGEVAYFSNLNNDDEYLEMEISRVNLLETLDTLKNSSLRIALFGFPAIFVGLLVDDSLIATLGWAISAIALMVWTGMNIGVKMLASRIPYELLETEDQN
ncbi:MAG TPA: hypothetical protein PLP07_06615 [Pyrinomonadaceae bacterium]|nr:hypothetical protein [Chloracidobacterium sp.]MBP9936107.1 hypothetical protein [Pyrinomonadaceae bacterium]HQX55582.1 hypothetical protein [Pyrinomonadaceae bacterium]HQY67364.1 hypothetical protein [Pyrinomonadaceae bacterium]HRA41417.1 hypothetical protein [Pyrinomonadaceae bacterium]